MRFLNYGVRAVPVPVNAPTYIMPAEGLPPHIRGRLVTLCPNAPHGFLQIVGQYLNFEQANTNFGSRKYKL